MFDRIRNTGARHVAVLLAGVVAAAVQPALFAPTRASELPTVPCCVKDLKVAVGEPGSEVASLGSSSRATGPDRRVIKIGIAVPITWDCELLRVPAECDPTSMVEAMVTVAQHPKNVEGSDPESSEVKVSGGTVWKAGLTFPWPDYFPCVGPYEGTINVVYTATYPNMAAVDTLANGIEDVGLLIDVGDDGRVAVGIRSKDQAAQNGKVTTKATWVAKP